MVYSRARQYFPMQEHSYVDDRDRLESAAVVKITWPENEAKPNVGIVRDFALFPYWTKYRRFLENNSINYDIYDIHSNDWIEQAHKFDIIVGFVSCDQYYLEEIQKKYYFLETYLGKKCFPKTDHIMLYENKRLEAYISKITDVSYAKTYISHSKEDALKLIKNLTYPIVSKVDPSSGSIGTELVRTPKQARKIITQAFSRNGRRVHVNYFRQKNYVYFQDYIPNDGYDVRVILVGNWAFGYYRKVLQGDFRASGMHMVEKRELPEGAILTAWKLNQFVKSPLLVVDMLRGQDDKFTIIEFSPICQMETPEQLHVRGIPGVYIIGDDGSIHFEQGRYWVHELALREFLINDYLPKSHNETRRGK